MAGTTIGSVLTVMLIFVAGRALSGRTFIHAIPVAFRAVKIRMFPFERETGVVVVERRVAPAAGGMTGTTIRTKLSVMGIPARMTGVTICRRSLIDAVRMA